MRIGLDHYTIAHRGLSPEATLEFACEHKLDGVQFLEPAAIDAGLDPHRLQAVVDKAQALGLYLEIGLPCPNPTRKARAEARDVTADEHARDLVPHLNAVAMMGCKHARAYIGDRHDRFRTDPNWTRQLGATLEVLKRLVPTLRDLGLKIAIETHADITVNELLRLLDALPEDVMGVTLDTGNLAMLLDDPVKSVEQLAPRVLTTHVKDAVLARTERGLCWQARPVGAGVLPMADLLSTLIRANPDLNFSIELHPRTYDLPIRDPSWLAHFPHHNMAAILALATKAEWHFSEGTLPRPEVVEAIPWGQRDLDGIAQSLGYLRALVPQLQKLTDGLDSPSSSSVVE